MCFILFTVLGKLHWTTEVTKWNNNNAYYKTTPALISPPPEEIWWPRLLWSTIMTARSLEERKGQESKSVPPKSIYFMDQQCFVK